MSEHAVQALWERVQDDADFRRKIEEAPTPEEKAQIVHAARFDVGPDDLLALHQTGSKPSVAFARIG